MILSNGLWLPSQRIAATGGGGGGPSPLLTGLASYYPLNEASGNAIDVHAGRNGVDTNTVGTFTPGILYPTARHHVAANSEYFAAADAAAFDFTTEMTVAGHFRMDDAIAQMAMITKFIATIQASWAFQTSPNVVAGGGFRVFIANAINDPGNNFANYDSTSLLNDTWYHAALVFNGALAEPDRVRVYLNAVLMTPSGKTGLWAASLLNSTTAIRIGDFEGLNRFWNGQLQGWGLWSRALIQPEIAAAMAAPYPW